jgi:hypothetical protein
MNKEQLLKRVLDKIGKEAIDRLKIAITTPINGKPLNASSRLKNTMSSEVVGNTVNIYMAKYAMDVEKGLKPRKNMKPSKGFVSNIQDWMKFKGILPENGRSTLQSANAIAQSIYNRGTIKRLGYAGARFIDRAVNNAMNQFDSDLLEAFTIDLQKELDKIK